MRAVWILYKKDLYSFFTQPVFYAVAGLCALFWSPLYVYSFEQFISQMVSVLGANGEYISYHERVVAEFVTLVNFTLLLFSNGITMKLLAEEKKNHTYELLMTSPIKSWQIILGKYLVGITVSSALIFISFLYPLSTGFLGKVQWPQLFAAYGGLILFSGVYIAVGLLGSALVSSVIMAFVLSLILNLSLMFLGVGAELSSSETMVRFFNYINWEPIFHEFSTGVIRLTSILYLVSVALIAAICAERLTESSRWK